MFILTYKDVEPNPTLEFANEIINKARGSQLIVSIGGGSTMDVAKFVSAELEIPHIAIPTTAGTGAEVTKYVVLTEGKEKVTLTNDKYKPDKYYHIPELLSTLSYQQRLSPALDALSQAIESNWQEATMESVLAVNQWKQFAMKYIANGDNAKEMQDVARLSGEAINQYPTGVCHAISYSLTKLYKMPHGLACALTLPYFVEKNGSQLMTKKDLLKIYEKLDIPRKIINPAKVANDCWGHPKIKENPFRVTKKDIIKSLQ